MTVIETVSDAHKLTLTVTAHFDAEPSEVWQLWADPRKLELWWGPPTWPATFVRYEFAPAGAARYFMTGPDGTKAPGWWTIARVDRPAELEFDQGFADESGEPVDESDFAHESVQLVDDDGGTRMTVLTTFQNAGQMEKMLSMGMAEGLSAAIGQMDAVLRDAITPR